jgi:2',3'-cyclic-nucleotide 2'-phosphodiesterase (5'-nucleotidase family)
MTQTDIWIVNSGSLRIDDIIPAGILKLKHIDALFPMQDEMITVRISGKNLVEVLENSLAALPKMDGCFPWISGMKVKYDSIKPVNERVLEVTVGDEPLCLTRLYTWATKEYIYGGKDGYFAFPKAELLTDGEQNPTLDIMVVEFLGLLTTKNTKWYSIKKRRAMFGLNLCNNNTMEEVHLDEEGKEMKYKYYKIFPKLDGRLQDVSAPHFA